MSFQNQLTLVKQLFKQPMILKLVWHEIIRGFCLAKIS